MSFEEYLISELGENANLLSEEQKTYLQDNFDNMNSWSQTARNALDMQFRGKAGIDYTNDYEKAMSEMTRYATNLKATINQIKEIFGISEEQSIGR